MIDDQHSPICSDSENGTKDEENQFIAQYQFKRASLLSQEKSQEAKNDYQTELEKGNYLCCKVNNSRGRE